MPKSISLCLLLWWPLSAFAAPAPAMLQSAEAQPAYWEMAFDDLGPADSSARSTENHGTAGPSLFLNHPRALAVRAQDFDRDGDYDVVLGGNGPSRVAVHYLDYSSAKRRWTEERVEILDDHTLACYDLDAGDINDDGFCDLAVGRRAGSLPSTEQDVLILNAGLDDGNGNWFQSPLSVPNPDPTSRDTFSIKLHDVDADGYLDVVESGNYGLRVYAWDPATDQLVFRFQARDPNDSTGFPAHVSPGIYRQMAIADIDGDGDDDLVIPRQWPSQTKAWFAQRIGPAPGVDPVQTPYVISDQAGLSNPPSLAVDYDVVGGCSIPGDSFTWLSETFEVALGDIDGDGDVDLIAANNFARNCLYLNDGNGYFGSDDDDVDRATDGQPAYEFTSATPDFDGPSPLLDLVYGNDSFLFDGNTPVNVPGLVECCQPPSPPLDPGCEWHYNFPGALLDRTTGVALHDLDGDGTTDWVAFSNRNDWEEFYLVTSAAFLQYPTATQVFPQIEGVVTPDEWKSRFVYLNDDPATYPTPAVYDHLYTNSTAPNPGAPVTFNKTVELLGEPNDGTSYGEFVHMNDQFEPFHADFMPDWLDANFSNQLQGGRNSVLWGHPLRARDANQVGRLDAGFLQVHFRMHLSLTEEIATGLSPTEELVWLVVPSGTDMYPDPAFDPWNLTPFYFPVVPDQFLTLSWTYLLKLGFMGTFSVPVPAAGTPLELDIDITLPKLLFKLTGVEDDVFFTVVVLKTDGPNMDLLWSSNALRMPLRDVDVPASPLIPSPFQ